MDVNFFSIYTNYTDCCFPLQEIRLINKLSNALIEYAMLTVDLGRAGTGLEGDGTAKLILKTSSLAISEVQITYCDR